jgi:hypothetical protein
LQVACKAIGRRSQSDCKSIVKRLQDACKAINKQLKSVCMTIAKQLQSGCKAIPNGKKRLRNDRNAYAFAFVFAISKRFRIECDKVARKCTPIVQRFESIAMTLQSDCKAIVHEQKAIA